MRKAAGARAALLGGIEPGLYIAGAVVVALVAISITGLVVRALATESSARVVPRGFAVLFGWQIGSFMRRKRPQGLRSIACAALLP